MAEPNLTVEQQQALQEKHGFVQGPTYVLMSMDVFREMMGVGSDEEMEASLKAIEEGLRDIEAGRTVASEDVFRELDRKYGVRR